MEFNGELKGYGKEMEKACLAFQVAVVLYLSLYLPNFLADDTSRLPKA